MIFIRTEDSTDGLELCKQIKHLYFDNIPEINTIGVNLDSLHGIWFLKDKLESLFDKLNEDDVLFIIYDDIPSNVLTNMYLNEALNWLDNNNYIDRVFWVGTNSFEVELVLKNCIEYFCNYSLYMNLVDKLRYEYFKDKDIDRLTKITKSDSLYDNMYASARKEKLKRRIYQNLSKLDFEKCITFETLSKQLKSKIFGAAPTDNPMKGCWIQNCCYRKNKCNNKFLDIDKMIKAHKNIDMLKTKWIIQGTNYTKLIKSVYNYVGIKYKLENIDIKAFLNKEVACSNYVYSMLMKEEIT